VYKTVFKPFMDRFFSLVILLLLSPVILIVYLLLLSKIGRPVIFRQERPGLNGKIFTIYKFRTMSNERDKITGELLSDEKRLSGIGATVRSLSLDELPQLINVLKGDMSFVGPRPLLVEYLELYNKKQARRHDVLPGITGWAQVNGRNAISWTEKFEYDVYYVDNVSFLMDIKIIWMTIKKVVKRSGVTQSGHVTMEKFRGNE